MSETKEVLISNHAASESVSLMGERLICRAETIMRRYPWIVLTFGAGLGYVASRRLL